VGSPWAIGSRHGGHTAIHPDLGTLDDFRALRDRARSLGVEIALDIAFQCAPDHPWVREHPEWFRHRPDGTIQYAENPPKKYEDIVPFDFECDAWEALWAALRDVVLFWCREGIRVFRVDNPHTKPFGMWEWLIAEVRGRHPETLFLSEAFTRPKVMAELARRGFSQSYTYFTWKNAKSEIADFVRELALARSYLRPNLWPNTPDILNAYLQHGGRAAFVSRAVLAATLSASWGVYGPPFELCEAEPREPGSEEYERSEKYEVRSWPLDRADSLAPLLRRLNRIRRDNPALQHDGVDLVDTDDPHVIAYLRSRADNVVLVVVNLDPHHPHTTTLHLPASAMGPAGGFQVHELLSGQRFFWTGPDNVVALDPARAQAMVFRVRHRQRTEADFEYFL
jgi:starch synthase (maltosyl-transferring)